MKVLVIDDEPFIADIFTQFLELLGHEADVAVDGREGLARFVRSSTKSSSPTSSCRD